MNENENVNFKYKLNNKIILYKDNLIKFVIKQKKKIIPIGNIEQIDYIVGILFLTETNKFCKINKIDIHGYYMAYTFINLFNKIRKNLFTKIIIDLDDLNHLILSLSLNIDYINSRLESSNKVKIKINNNLSKLLIQILPIIEELNLYCADIYNFDEYAKYILSKFFYILLQTAKFIGSGVYNEPNLIKLAEYYSNIFYTFFKSKNIMESDVDTIVVTNDLVELTNNTVYTQHIELYENYLNYKNKLNYSLIELDLNSDTLDEIISYLDNEIINYLSIKVK